jgi:hypothetical protein
VPEAAGSGTVLEKPTQTSRSAPGTHASLSD